jgi:hypothetical protein
MQDSMFIVFKDHLKTKKGQQLISQFESTRDAWRIYHKLKEHTMSLQVLQLLAKTSAEIRLEDNDVKDLLGRMFEDVWHWEEEER